MKRQTYDLTRTEFTFNQQDVKRALEEAIRVKTKEESLGFCGSMLINFTNDMELDTIILVFERRSNDKSGD